jgi:hypothetical protein
MFLPCFIAGRMVYAYTSGKAPALITVAIFAAVALLFLCWIAGGPYTEAFPQPFNSARWKASDTYNKIRCGMILDLQFRIGVVGKTRSELSGLLGVPVNRMDDPSFSQWFLCPSFLDLYVLEVRWQDGRAVSATVHDT